MSDKTPERLALEARATALGLSFPANIGDAKLQGRVEKAEAKANGAGSADGTQPQGDPQQPPTPEQPLASMAGGGIEVTGPRKGRWRAGWFFTKEPVRIPADDLTEEIVQALKSDPKLSVTHIEAEE